MGLLLVMPPEKATMDLLNCVAEALGFPAECMLDMTAQIQTSG